MKRPIFRRGFTFLEVVCSLALILLVLGVLLPVFLRGKETARRAQCASNLQQLASAVHLYAQDHDGRFPPEDHHWAPVMPYVKNSQIFTCDSEPRSERERWRSGIAVNGPDGNTVELYSSYQYRGGLANDDTASTPLAMDWDPWHHAGVNVLHLGGDVQWVRTRRPAPLTATPRPRPGKEVPLPSPTPTWMEEPE